ncbi:protein rep, partial [Salmonella enterica]|nr:protein rep [Salmonella enterica]
MLYKNNKAYGDNVNAAEVPFLTTYATENGKRLNERKSKSVKLAKLYYKKAETLENATAEAMRKRAGRVFGCCSRREVAVSAGGYCYNLSAYRCRDRNCTECQRIRAFVLQQKIREITPELIKQTSSKDGLIFGTLTIKNPPIKELKAYLKILSAAFTRLMRRKEFKQISIGGFRCFEVTRGEAGDEFCHPHIHFLLQVRAEYFSRKSPLYIKSETWAEAWTDCLEKEVVKTGREFNRADYPSGKAFVKILRVQAPGYTRENRKYATISTLQTEGDQVINYVLKYTAVEDEKS